MRTRNLFSSFILLAVLQVGGGLDYQRSKNLSMILVSSALREPNGIVPLENMRKWTTGFEGTSLFAVQTTESTCELFTTLSDYKERQESLGLQNWFVSVNEQSEYEKGTVSRDRANDLIYCALYAMQQSRNHLGNYWESAVVVISSSEVPLTSDEFDEGRSKDFPEEWGTGEDIPSPSDRENYNNPSLKLFADALNSTGASAAFVAYPYVDGVISLEYGWWWQELTDKEGYPSDGYEWYNTLINVVAGRKPETPFFERFENAVIATPTEEPTTTTEPTTTEEPTTSTEMKCCDVCALVSS